MSFVASLLGSAESSLHVLSIILLGLSIVQCKLKRPPAKSKRPTSQKAPAVKIPAPTHDLKVEVKEREDDRQPHSDGDEPTSFELQPTQRTKTRKVKMAEVVTTQQSAEGLMQMSKEKVKSEVKQKIKSEKEDKTQNEQSGSAKTARPTTKRDAKVKKHEVGGSIETAKSPVVGSEEWDAPLPFAQPKVGGSVRTAKPKRQKHRHAPSNHRRRLTDEEKEERDRQSAEKAKRKRDSRKHEERDEDTLFEVTQRTMPTRVFSSETEVQLEVATTQLTRSSEEIPPAARR